MALLSVAVFGFSFYSAVGTNAEWMRNVGSFLFGGVILSVIGSIPNSNINSNKNDT